MSDSEPARSGECLEFIPAHRRARPRPRRVRHDRHRRALVAQVFEQDSSLSLRLGEGDNKAAWLGFRKSRAQSAREVSHLVPFGIRRQRDNDAHRLPRGQERVGGEAERLEVAFEIERGSLDRLKINRLVRVEAENNSVDLCAGSSAILWPSQVGARRHLCLQRGIRRDVEDVRALLGSAVFSMLSASGAENYCGAPRTDSLSLSRERFLPEHYRTTDRLSAL